MKQLLVVTVFLLIVGNSLAAQTHASVSVDNRVYAIIEHAQMRGLCPALPVIKPYPENIITEIINIILSASETSEKRLLSKIEEQILRDTLEQFQRKRGLDVLRGGYYFEGKGKIRATLDAAVKADSYVSGGLYTHKNDSQWGLWITPTISLRGDLGTHLSYDFSIFGNMSRAVLKYLGDYSIGKFW